MLTELPPATAVQTVPAPLRPRRRRHALVPVAGHLREGLVDHAREHFAEIRERVDSEQ